MILIIILIGFDNNSNNNLDNNKKMRSNKIKVYKRNWDWKKDKDLEEIKKNNRKLISLKVGKIEKVLFSLKVGSNLKYQSVVLCKFLFNEFSCLLLQHLAYALWQCSQSAESRKHASCIFKPRVNNFPRMIMALL